MACAVIGSISIYKSSNIIKDYANNELLLTVKNKTFELNNILSKMETSVNRLEQELERDIDISQLKNNSVYIENLKRHLSPTIESVSKNTTEALGTYFVLNPDLSSGGQGVWYTDLDGTGKYTSQQITDITKFSKDDKEHVGWFYEPIKASKGIWMKPYLNKNINMYIISFVKPMYINNTVIGIVGMDFKVDNFTKLIKDVKINKIGYFFLLDNEYNYLIHPTVTQDKNMKTISNGKFAYMVDAIEKNKTGTTGTIEANFEGVEKILGYSKLSNGYTLLVNTSTAEVFAKRNDLLIITLSVTLISIIISIIIAFLLGIRISKPILITKEVLETTSNFDLSADKEFKLKSTSNDEITLMMQSLTKVRSSLRNIIYKLKNSSYKVNEDSLNISKAMKETSTSISDISRSVTDLAEGVFNQSKSVQEGANVLDNLASKIDEVTNSSNIMKQSIYETNEVGEKSISSIKKLGEEIIKNTEMTNTIGTSIESLSQKSNSIGEITNVIKSIAYKTNLLSLNAMLESAKAGAYGKGFSVVAEEIKKLAYETNSSAKQIGDIILKIQKDIENTNTDMNKVNVSNRELNSVIFTTKQDFEKILNSIANIVSQVSILENNIAAMNKDKDTVMASIQEISSITEESSASTEEISAAIEQQSAVIADITKMTEDLKILSQQLNSIVNEFKI